MSVCSSHALSLNKATLTLDKYNEIQLWTHIVVLLCEFWSLEIYIEIIDFWALNANFLLINLISGHQIATDRKLDPFMGSG